MKVCAHEFRVAEVRPAEVGVSEIRLVKLRLVSKVGTYVGRVKIDEIKPGNLEVHWPEGNCLLSREEMDFASREPDYNAIVKVEKAIGTVAT